MSFQEELSRNARDPKVIAQQKAEQEDQQQRERAEHLAHEIWGTIQQELMEAVQRGEYTKQGNKGTVSCYYTLPFHYVDSNPQIERNKRTHQTIRTWYNFQPKPEKGKEYYYLRNNLEQFGSKNGVKFSWIVKVGTFRTTFPSTTPVVVPDPYAKPVEFLVKAVSDFAVDPNYPIDYVTEKEHQAKIRNLENRYQEAEEKRKNCLWKMVISIFLLAIYVAMLLAGYLSGILYVIFFVVILLVPASIQSYREASNNAKLIEQLWKEAEYKQKNTTK